MATVEEGLIPATCIAAIPYIYFLGKYLIDKKDPNWQAGILCLVEPIRWTGRILKNHILGWFMKGFFLPLMFQAARSAPLAALEMYGR